MKQKRMIIILVLAFLVSLPPLRAGAKDEKVEKRPSRVEIGSGTIGGSAYIMSSQLAKLIQDELRIPASAIPTSGSAENIGLLDRKKIELGIVAANNSYPAYKGESPFDKPVASLRVVMGIYSQMYLLVTVPETGMTKFTDIKGKRVCLGASAKTWAFALYYLEAHGLSQKDVTLVWAGFSDAHRQLGDRVLDAVNSGTAAGMLYPASRELMVTRKIVPLEFDSKAIDKIVAHYPYVAKGIISKEALGTNKDFATFDYGRMSFMTYEEMDEETVYRIAKLTHKNLKKLASEDPQWKDALDRPEILVPEMGIPYHPGAIRYWKEAGLWKK